MTKHKSKPVPKKSLAKSTKRLGRVSVGVPTRLVKPRRGGY